MGHLRINLSGAPLRRIRCKANHFHRLWRASSLCRVARGFLFLFGEETADKDAPPAVADPTPGGFPVPPLPAGGPVRGAAAPLTFDTPISSPATSGAGKEAHADG